MTGMWQGGRQWQDRDGRQVADGHDVGQVDTQDRSANTLIRHQGEAYPAVTAIEGCDSQTPPKRQSIAEKFFSRETSVIAKGLGTSSLKYPDTLELK